MAEFRVALGATADIVSGSEFSDGMSNLRRDIVGGLTRQKPIKRPLAVSLSGSGVSYPKALGDLAILKLGRPASGRVWVVTRITVMGDDDHFAPANLVAAIYIGDAAQMSQSQVVQHGQAIPFTSIENEKAFVAHDREDVFIGLTGTGTTTGSNIVATALAWEYADSALDAQRI